LNAGYDIPRRFEKLQEVFWANRYASIQNLTGQTLASPAFENVRFTIGCYAACENQPVESRFEQ
jgi:hypothetical protein